MYCDSTFVLNWALKIGKRFTNNRIPITKPIKQTIKDSPQSWIKRRYFEAPNVFLTPISRVLFKCLAMFRLIKLKHAISIMNIAKTIKAYTKAIGTPFPPEMELSKWILLRGCNFILNVLNFEFDFSEGKYFFENVPIFFLHH